MNNSVYDKAVLKIVRELLENSEKTTLFDEYLLKAFLFDLFYEAEQVIRSGGDLEQTKDEYIKISQERIRENSTELLEAFLNNSEVEKKLYTENYAILKAILDENNDYQLLYKELYQDEYFQQEIFVRLVEEKEGTVVKSAKQLQELTGITEVYGEWDEEKQELIPYKDKEPTTKEAQEEADRQIKETFTQGMVYRYTKALEDILKGGGVYSELLKVKPSYFNLPETWSGHLATDKHSSILWAIVDVFSLMESNSSVRPDLRSIAQEIEAPYSVIMDAYKLVR